MSTVEYDLAEYESHLDDPDECERCLQLFDLDDLVGYGEMTVCEPCRTALEEEEDEEEDDVE